MSSAINSPPRRCEGCPAACIPHPSSASTPHSHPIDSSLRAGQCFGLFSPKLCSRTGIQTAGSCVGACCWLLSEGERAQADRPLPFINRDLTDGDFFYSASFSLLFRSTSATTRKKTTRRQQDLFYFSLFFHRFISLHPQHPAGQGGGHCAARHRPLSRVLPALRRPGGGRGSAGGLGGLSRWELPGAAAAGGERGLEGAGGDRLTSAPRCFQVRRRR